MSDDPALFADGLRLVHRCLGWPTIFVLGPLALLTRKGGTLHRRAGIAYVVGMGLLWLSGSWFTFAHDELFSWRFKRDFAFNLLGAAQGFLGWRAVRRRVVDGRLTSGIGDAIALLLQFLLAGVLVALVKKDPVVGWLGLLFALIAVSEARATLRGGATSATPMRLHVQRMVASYFYALTVVLIVRLDLPHVVKWGAPSLVALTLLACARKPGVARSIPRASLVAAALVGALLAWQELR